MKKQQHPTAFFYNLPQRAHLQQTCWNYFVYTVWQEQWPVTRFLQTKKQYYQFGQHCDKMLIGLDILKVGMHDSLQVTYICKCPQKSPDEVLFSCCFLVLSLIAKDLQSLRNKTTFQNLLWSQTNDICTAPKPTSVSGKLHDQNNLSVSFCVLL